MTTSILSPRLRFAMNSIAFSAFLACLSGQIHAQTAVGTGTSSVRAGEPVTLNFANAEIEAVARTVATLSGANVVVDPRVKGTMSLSSTTPVRAAQALRLFSAQLRTQGYALVENAGIHTVVPEADAKLQSGPVNAGNAPAAGLCGPVLAAVPSGLGFCRRILVTLDTAATVAPFGHGLSARVVRIVGRAQPAGFVVAGGHAPVVAVAGQHRIGQR